MNKPEERMYTPNLQVQNGRIAGDFRGVMLSHADWRNASVFCALSNADLTYADLRGAEFYNVAWEGTKLGNIKADGTMRVTCTNAASKWWQADFSVTDGGTDDAAIEFFFQCWTNKYELKTGTMSPGTILGEAHATVQPKFRELLEAYLKKPI
jgi:Pentapeptide repeats (8 copies)